MSGDDPRKDRGWKSPLRVLSVLDSLGQGGAERSLVDLASSLRAHQIQTTVAVLHARDDGFAASADDSGLEVVNLGPGRLEAIVNLRRLIKVRGIDLVHTTLFEASVVGRLGAMGLDRPVVTSLVNVSYDAIRLRDPKVSPVKLRLARVIDGWTARHLNTGFHALTEAVADSAIEDLGITSTSVFVIPRGRDDDEFHPPASVQERDIIRGAFGVGTETPLLVNVGRHEFQKGQRHLIDAMPLILERWPGTVLLIAGREGNETRSLTRQVESLGLQTQVRLLGDRRDVNELLRAADVFVFPSLYEGFGGALIEAMASGLPIVASDLTPIREVVSGAAVLTPPAVPEELSAAVVSLLSDPDGSRAMADEGLARFRDSYRLETVAAATADFYRSVVTAR